MISALKNKSIEKAYNRIISTQKTKKKTVQPIKKVAVLLDNEALVNIVTANLTNKLPFKKGNITVLVYRGFSKKQEVSPLFFTDKEIGFKASLKSDNLKHFVKNEYDLLINYTKSSNIYTNTITLLSEAKFKAGFTNIDDRLFDIVVADDNFNEAVLNQELKKYLTILNKI